MDDLMKPDNEHTPENKIPDINSIENQPPPPQPQQPFNNSYGYPSPEKAMEAYYQNIPSFSAEAAAAKEKKAKINRERIIVALFILLVLFAFVLGIAGIAYDIITSQRRLDAFGKADHVVIYQNSKPDKDSDAAFEKDENGRYTTEGVAAAVRESIVEIYTYSDAFQKNLEGTGSGVILTKDGYIVTNAHVLSAEGFHEVHTADERIYSAKVIGRDSKTDIAVLKITASDLVPAVLGDSDEVVVGEQVIAIGNPAGLTGSVTDGIVSAVNRKIKSDSSGFQMNCIQTNAAISPGNSGGALVNMYGQVIGITSSKYASGYYEGLGFAITINEAKPLIEELINNGFVSGRFRIGITLIDMSNPVNVSAIEEELGFEIPEDFHGIYINEISEDCDIANTDLVAGDFLTEIDGEAVNTYDEMYDAIASKYGAGDKVPATCAHIDKNGKIKYYNIEFMLMEDTSGNY